MTHEEFQKKVMRLARRECSPDEAGMIALELIRENRLLRIAAGLQPVPDTNDQSACAEASADRRPTTNDPHAERA